MADGARGGDAVAENPGGAAPAAPAAPPEVGADPPAVGPDPAEVGPGAGAAVAGGAPAEALVHARPSIRRVRGLLTRISNSRRLTVADGDDPGPCVQEVRNLIEAIRESPGVEWLPGVLVDILRVVAQSARPVDKSEVDAIADLVKDLVCKDRSLGIGKQVLQRALKKSGPTLSATTAGDTLEQYVEKLLHPGVYAEADEEPKPHEKAWTKLFNKFSKMGEEDEVRGATRVEWRYWMAQLGDSDLYRDISARGAKVGTILDNPASRRRLDREFVEYVDWRVKRWEAAQVALDASRALTKVEKAYKVAAEGGKLDRDARAGYKSDIASAKEIRDAAWGVFEGRPAGGGGAAGGGGGADGAAVGGGDEGGEEAGDDGE